MQTTAKTNLVLNGFSSLKPLVELLKQNRQTGLYQQSAVLWLMQRAGAQEDFSQLGRKLVALAEHAYSLRQMDTVDQASQLLLNLPISHQDVNIGRYYYALCLQRQYRYAEAGALFARIAEEASSLYRARALMSFGANSFYMGDFHSALPLYVEAGRVAAHNWSDPFTAVHTQKMVAVLKSLDGDHRGALGHLENLFPLVRAVSSSHPSLYYDYLNSLAVELMEVGRLEEAQNASQKALASPFAAAYPEWRETREEIGLRGHRAARSVAAVNPATLSVNNLLLFPLNERRERQPPARFAPGHLRRPARILNYAGWKQKMVEEPDGMQKDAPQPHKMTDREMMLRLIQLVSARERTTEELEMMLAMVEKIATRQADENEL